MRTMIVLGRRRSIHRFRFFLIFFVFFLTGFLLGLFYLPSAESKNISPTLLLKNQWFYSGDFAALRGADRALPPFHESESTDLVWDVASYEDAVTKEVIPVFVSSATDSAADLIRVNQESLALTALVDDTPRVLIYCTHTSEDYAGGGTVLDVAYALSAELETGFGVKAVVSDTVHDSPEWYKSYANSRATALKMLEQYPEAELLIDLHRDSGKSKSASTIRVNGSNLAKILLVVGSNMTLKHPNWEENLQTAKALAANLEQVNGDMVSGVRVQKGRYNQHLTANAVLLEFGTNLNTVEEAKASAALVAQAIALYLQS